MTATVTTLTRYMRKRPGSAMWQLRKPVPADVQEAFGRTVVTRSLGTADDRAATIAAISILDSLEQEWASLRLAPAATAEGLSNLESIESEPSDKVKQAIIRAVFEKVSREFEARDNAAFKADREAHFATLGERRKKLSRLSREVRAGLLDPFEGPLEQMLLKRGERVDRSAPWFQQFARDAATTVLDARAISIRADDGEIDPRPTTAVVKRALDDAGLARVAKDVSFAELVDQFMRQWLVGRSSGKVTNTEQQKRATFRLFGGFFDNRPVRQVRQEDAAAFFDQLRLFDPNWARSPETRGLSWPQRVERYANRVCGLSDATMNRHLQVLKELWAWSRKRGYCAGENPFEGFRKRLRAGVNVKPYVAWETDELRRLLSPPPKRKDLLEIIIIGMFTGMRLDEIASLTWGQVRSSFDDGVVIHYFQVEDAKTTAGNRMVPVHPHLSWLLSRHRGADSDRVWPTFNLEGPSKKPGADAGREFSTFKIAKGFRDRAKVFHSFRKNVTGMIERAGVSENDWAQIFGHERGFTYAVYSPDGITMKRRAEIIALISYPGIAIPHPAA
jgi:integrase